MLDRFEAQALRAAIADLTTRVAPAVQDPSAGAALSMASRLLAHVLERGNTPALTDVAVEVAALLGEEQREDQALAPPVGKTAGKELSVEALTDYVGARIKGAKVTAIEASLGGFSKRTLILRLSGAPQIDDGLVVRCDEPGGPVESASAAELPILKLMHKHGVAVAEPLWADTAFPFGGTALCTRRIAGSSAYDATGAALGPRGPQAARELAQVLAKVHAVSPTELDLSPELRSASVQEHVARMMTAYRSQWQRHPARPSPVIEAAFDYLLSNVPKNAGAPTIVHGDASLRNLLLDGDRISGLVDWELWHLGDYNEDLAYCRPDVEQAMPWADFLAEYRKHGGGEFRPEAGAYFGVFGALRNFVFGATIIHGFASAEHPETRYAFAASYLARKLIPVVAQQLAALQSKA